MHTLTDPKSHSPSTVGFSRDGKLMAWAVCQAEEGQVRVLVRVWDGAAKREKVVLETRSMSQAGTVAFSPDGQLLAVGGPASPVQVWNLVTGKKGPTLPPGGAPRYARGFAFSPDGKTIACGDDRTIRLYDPAKGKERSSLPGQAWAQGIAFSPDGRSLVSAGYTGPIQVWDVASGKQRNKVEAPVALAAAAPDGKVLALRGGRADRLLLWDAAGWKVSRELSLPGPRAFGAVSFSPDGRYLAAVVGDDRAQVWDLSREDHYVTLMHPGVTDLIFTPDGKALLSLSRSADTAKRWDAPGRPLDATRWAGLFDLSLAGAGDRWTETADLVEVARHGHFTHAGRPWEALHFNGRQ